MKSNYEQHLTEQFQNSQKPALKLYFQKLYGNIQEEFDTKGKILEIGSGAGISKFFLPESDILRTDILPWEAGDVVGDIDASSLPYPNARFDGLFGVDVLHHLPFPMEAIKEAARVVKPGKSIVFIEPYVSVWSFFIFKIFHEEKTSLFLKFDSSREMVGTEPQDGDQRIAQSLFVSVSGRREVLRVFRDRADIQIKFLHPFSFFLTGGLSKPLPTHPKILNVIMKLELKIPQKIVRLLSSRIMITINLKY